jgi:Cu+-exporting ATPase
MTLEPKLERLVLTIERMDCADCTRHIQQAIAGVAGVQSMEVLLGAEKAIIQLNPAMATVEDLRRAVAEAGYSVPDQTPAAAAMQGSGG